MIQDILRELIRIDTRTSQANETEAAVYLKGLCDRFDIENQILEPIQGKGSLIARIPGTDPSKKELLLLAHLDTADFGELEKWHFPPLAATEYKGRIFGRGAIDCKGLASVWMSILINLRQKGLQPERGILFAAVADEESGGEYGMKYLIEHNEGIKNCGCVIGEGGGYPIQLEGTTYYTCQNAEKGRVAFRVSEPGEGVEMGKEIYTGHPIINLLKGILITKIYDGELLRFFTKQPFSRAHKRRLDFKGMLCGSYSLDRDEKGERLTIYEIPGMKAKDFSVLRNKLASLLRNAEMTSHIPASYSRVDTELYQVIVRKTKEHSAKDKVIPYTTPGYSDNRLLRDKGRAVYGYFPLTLEDGLAGIHGHDENITIEGLLHAYDLLNRIVQQFTYTMPSERHSASGPAILEDSMIDNCLIGAYTQVTTSPVGGYYIKE